MAESDRCGWRAQELDVDGQRESKRAREQETDVWRERDRTCGLEEREGAILWIRRGKRERERAPRECQEGESERAPIEYQETERESE